MKEIELFKRPVENAPAFAVRSIQKEDFGRNYIRGDVFITLRDGTSGEIQDYREMKNLVVLDASILIARLLRDPSEPPHGIYALGFGTGASGWDPMNPPAPVVTQRALHSELVRKTFTSIQFIDSGGAPTAVPTHVTDYTCQLAEAEGVGPLVEMGLMSPLSSNMSVKNPVPPGPYDPTVDLTLYDTLVNALNFAVINKPATSTLTVVWRLTT
jgi:hypothetical protein